MKWAENLYVDSRLSGLDTDTLRRQIQDASCPRTMMIITAAAGLSDQLDIRPAGSWASKCLQAGDPVIFGIASGKEEAVQMLVEIAQQCYEQTGGMDLRSFLMRQTGMGA